MSPRITLDFGETEGQLRNPVFLLVLSFLLLVIFIFIYVFSYFFGVWRLAGVKVLGTCSALSNNLSSLSLSPLSYMCMSIHMCVGAQVCEGPKAC